MNKMRRLSKIFITAAVVLCSTYQAFANKNTEIELSVNNVIRKAIISCPSNANDTPCPVIIAFHGHGGSMENAVTQFDCEKYWHDAIVVYPQGLNTPGTLLDKKGKYAGWQSSLGDQNNRDLDFFDSILSYLKNNFCIDTNRIYLIGHSNGGLFTCELWLARRDTITAICLISSIIPQNSGRAKLEPIPAFIVAGKNDKLVKIRWQNESINFLAQLNKCGLPVEGKNKNNKIYHSSIGYNLMTYVSNGGHEIPSESIPLIIDFFKTQ